MHRVQHVGDTYNYWGACATAGSDTPLPSIASKAIEVAWKTSATTQTIRCTTSGTTQANRPTTSSRSTRIECLQSAPSAKRKSPLLPTSILGQEGSPYWTQDLRVPFAVRPACDGLASALRPGRFAPGAHLPRRGGTCRGGIAPSRHAPFKCDH